MKNKLFRPRRGMRVRGPKPGSEPITSFVNQSNKSLGTKLDRNVDIVGEVFGSIGRQQGDFVDHPSPAILSASAVIETSVTSGRRYETKKLNAILLGLPKTDVDSVPFPSTVVMDVVQTGTFVSPSWTQKSIGIPSAFVIGDLSSSIDRTLNTLFSGYETVENTANPATFPIHSSKIERYQTLTVKKTASFFDTISPGSGTFVPSQFFPGTGTLVNVVTGTNVPASSGTFQKPATFFINVPEKGQLVDIKVWVEIAQVSASNATFPLGTLGIALRSPNLKWGHAHPIRNDPEFASAESVFKSFLASYTLGVYDMYNPIPNFYRDSFLLWEAPGAIYSDGAQLDYFSNAFRSTSLERYPCWQKDRSMRTVFDDGSNNANPRHLSFIQHRISSDGNTVLQNTNTTPVGNCWKGSPNANGIMLLSPTKAPTTNAIPGVNEVSVNTTGSDWPWTSDATIFPGTGSHQGPGSPPNGWLTGPGKTAAINEWPTTGVNYGAETLRPLYPLLDDIVVKKIAGGEKAILNIPSNTAQRSYYDPNRWNGFRPGLRGTEISGTWELMVISKAAILNATPDEPSASSPPTYFRQVRLELTYEPERSKPTFVDRISPYSPRKKGIRFINRISGTESDIAAESAPWDYFVSDVYAIDPGQSELGRSFGISLGSASNSTEFALSYKLTGTLGTIFGETPSWILQNDFGIPRIPASSASFIERETLSQPSISPNGFMSPVKSLDGPRKLELVASDVNPAASIDLLSIAFVSSSTT